MYLFYAVCVVWKGLKLKEVGWSLAPFLPRKVGVPEGRCPAWQGIHGRSAGGRAFSGCHMTQLAGPS